MTRHVNFSPERNPPPRIPQASRDWGLVYDGSGIWSRTAHVRLFDIYCRHPSWTWKNGKSAEWLVLGGAFLKAVRGISDIVDFDRRVDEELRSRAKVLCSRLKPAEVVTFEDGGNELMTADIGMTHIRLSLSRFYLWWEARGKIGPPQPLGGGRQRAKFECSVQWTLYDYYDFKWFELYGYLGNPYNIHARWDTVTLGSVECAAPPPQVAKPQTFQKIPASSVKVKTPPVKTTPVKTTPTKPRDEAEIRRQMELHTPR